MKRILASACLTLLAIMVAATAGAEKTVTVNDPALPGVYDQPSAVAAGDLVHVAYIGAASTAGPFLLFYAAIDGGSNFTDLSLSRTTPGFLVTPPTAIDNTAPGNDAYVDARHPRIAVRSSNEVDIIFQAKSVSSPDPAYALYLAQLTLQDDTVVKQTVRLVTGLSGFNEDVSFALNTSDGTARIAYAGRAGISGDFNVYYARVSLDTATVTGSPGTPLLLSTVPGSSGSRPLPSLRLDSAEKAHVAWAANSDLASANGVYYALVKETNGVDTVAIAATEILGRSRKWGFPMLLVSSKSSIIIMAIDESQPEFAGEIGLVNINPEKDDQDGSPVQVSTDTDFLLTPPGEAILPVDFNLFRPEAFLDSISQIHITGYGTGGTRSTYYGFRLTSGWPYVQFQKIPVPVGLDSSEFPVSLTGDYTRSALAFLTGGKVVIFWSGEVSGTGNRNLDVTGLPAASAIDVGNSGCTVVSTPVGEKTFRIPDIILLLALPLVLLWIRRARKATNR
jgi:hypothetical protein